MSRILVTHTDYAPENIGTNMLASGRAILATALPGTGVATALAPRDLVAPPGEIDTFVVALRQLAGEVARRAGLARAARHGDIVA